MTAPRPEAVELAERIARGRVYVPISSVAWLASLIDAAITAAEERAREEQREKGARVCERIYREHKRSKAYPVDMGGLCKECAAAIREGR